MTNEQLVMSEAYDILSMAEGPLTTAQLQKRLSHKVTQSELESMLHRTVYEQAGVAKGYTPGSFIKVDGKWSVKQLSIDKDTKFSPTGFISAII